MRGTFANIRLRNKMVPRTEDGVTKLMPTGEEMSIFAAASRYAEQRTPLVIIAGKEYGTGSSRDWAAKGVLLLGVQAVLSESFERIHRSNLVGMRVLPLQFPPGVTAETLNLDGSETISLNYSGKLQPKQSLLLQISGVSEPLEVLCRLDTAEEVAYFQSGNILNHVLLNLLDNQKGS